ncbi:hypothetical protein D3C78_1392830 [compost metagenome]
MLFTDDFRPQPGCPRLKRKQASLHFSDRRPHSRLFQTGEQLTGGHPVPLLDQQLFQYATIHRLDDLYPAAGNDLPSGAGDFINAKP